MVTADSVKSKLQGLIDQANAATGNTDADLTSALSALIAGYGHGGGVSLTDVDVYVADFYTDEVAVTAGALDVYKRIIIS